MNIPRVPAAILAACSLTLTMQPNPWLIGACAHRSPSPPSGSADADTQARVNFPAT